MTNLAKMSRTLPDISELLQLHENYLGPSGSSGAFEKLFRSFPHILELLQIHKYYFGPSNSSGVILERVKREKNF